VPAGPTPNPTSDNHGVVASPFLSRPPCPLLRLPFLPYNASSPPLPSQIRSGAWLCRAMDRDEHLRRALAVFRDDAWAGECRAGSGGAGCVIRKQPLPIPSPPRPGMHDSQAAEAVARSSIFSDADLASGGARRLSSSGRRHGSTHWVRVSTLSVERIRRRRQPRSSLFFDAD
ncbi:unnamed protein product, partial [Urochloa humidicola]